MLSMSRDVIDLAFLNKTTVELGLTQSWNIVLTTDA